MRLTERDLENPDPLRVDREIAEMAGSCRRAGRLLRRGLGEGEDPFLVSRLVAGRTLFRVLTELAPSDPLREPLRRFVYRLAEERVQWHAQANAARERYLTERRVEAPEHARLPLSAMLSSALAERPRREGWLAAFLQHAEAASAAESLTWERRQEFSLRMGEAGPDAIELPFADLAGVARRFVERTDDLFGELRRATLAGFLDVALASATAEGWPRRLTPRALLDPFRETDLFRSLDLDPGELPPALAPTSFTRGLLRLGAAWVDATAPTDQPFVIAHDPYGLRRRTVGALFGSLPRCPPFALRALGLDRSRMRDHLRILGGAALVAARLGALRVLLRAPALAGRSALRESHEEGTHRTLGIALPASSAAALVRLHPDDGQRFAGLLLGAKQASELCDVHDVDWYRNPRAVEELRDRARLSPETRTDAANLEAGATAFVAGVASNLR